MLTDERKQDVMTKLGALISPSKNDEIVNVMVDLVTTKIYSKLKAKKQSVEEYPKELDYLIVDLVVARYNRVGAEGMSTEAMSNKTNSYIDDYENKEIETAIEDYINSLDDEMRNGNQFGDFLFLWDTIEKLRS